MTLPAAAEAATVDVTAQPTASVGQAVAVTVDLPGNVAAVEARVLTAGGAADVVGAAPVSGRVLEPAGSSVGAYGMRASHGRSVLRVVLSPNRAGKLQVRVVVDAAADRAGRRVQLGRVDRVVTIRVANGARVLRAPSARAAKAAGASAGTRDLIADGVADARDVDVARGAWDAAHRGAAIGGDVNRDGVVDIVDVQRAVAADAADPSTPPKAVKAPMTFTVDSNLDLPDATPGNGLCATTLGTCTLRAAITEADWNLGADRIEFNIPLLTAPVQIQLTSRLPYITSRSGGVTIDGYTQPGSKVNDAQFASNAIPGIELRGNGNAAREVGLYITSPGNTVRGLMIHNVYRAILLDGVDARNNTIVGNWIGFRPGGLLSTKGNFAIVVNVGANTNTIGRPNLADRNVIGNYSHGVEFYGPGSGTTTIQNNLFCMRPDGLNIATCEAGIDHNFGPKGNLIGGFGTLERNVIGPTNYQGIELSHGWNPALQPREDNSIQYQINNHRILGNWVGFRADGSYSAAFRSGRQVFADNGQGINLYDGVHDNLVEGNYVAAIRDGIDSNAPNASRNTYRNNVIGESPLGEAAPMSGWGIAMRWQTFDNVIEGNTIKNAATGGVGLIENTVHNVRISRNTVVNSNGLGIDLFGVLGSEVNDAGDGDAGANTLLNSPAITIADTGQVGGTAQAGSTVEVFRATRAAGEFGLPSAYLGSATVAANGSWSLNVTLAVGDVVTASQIRPDNNTSELAANVAVGSPPAQPQPGDIVASDDFTRVVAGGWGVSTLGGTWTISGNAPDFAVDGSAGSIVTAAGQTRESRLAIGRADVDVKASVTLDRLPGAGNAFAYALARQNGTTAFRAAIRVAPNGAVFVQLKRAVNNTESNLTNDTATGVTIAAGQALSYRLRVVGQHLQFRVWNAAGAEPATWNLEADDATAALQAPGGIGLRTFTGGSVPNGPITFALDNLEVRIP